MLLKIGGAADLTGAPQVQPRRSPPAPRPPGPSRTDPGRSSAFLWRSLAKGALRPRQRGQPGSPEELIYPAKTLRLKKNKGKKNFIIPQTKATKDPQSAHSEAGCLKQ